METQSTALSAVKFACTLDRAEMPRRPRGHVSLRTHGDVLTAALIRATPVQARCAFEDSTLHGFPWAPLPMLTPVAAYAQRSEICTGSHDPVLVVAIAEAVFDHGSLRIPSAPKRICDHTDAPFRILADRRSGRIFSDVYFVNAALAPRACQRSTHNRQEIVRPVCVDYAAAGGRRKETMGVSVVDGVRHLEVATAVPRSPEDMPVSVNCPCFRRAK